MIFMRELNSISVAISGHACELTLCRVRVSTGVGKGLGVWQVPHRRMDRQIGGRFVCGCPEPWAGGVGRGRGEGSWAMCPGCSGGEL